MAVYKSITELIGNTPLIELVKYERTHNIQATLLGKLESLNPAGSSKDRIADFMIREACEAKNINEETVLIEPTSGNTGIGLAALAAAQGLRLIITMPETMSRERRLLMKAYGAELVLTDGTQGMTGAINKAHELHEQIPNSIILGQFTNPANPAAHKATTGPEIWKDTEGNIDILVAGIGTGGTISGAGAYLKSQNPDIRVVGVEPAGSPVLTEHHGGTHHIEGIGAGFVPDLFDSNICDEVLAITDEAAYETTRELAQNEGLLVGISSGAAVAAALQLAQRKHNEKAVIVIILPDSGERYLTTEAFTQHETEK